MEWRWSLEGENRKEESGDEEMGFENGPRESQEEETPLSSSCQNSGFVNRIFLIICDLNV